MDYIKTVEKIKPKIALVFSLDGQNNLLGTGSGFVFLKKGILVTCNHVIKDGVNILLQFPGGTPIGAKIVINDIEHDLALLKFDENNIEPLIAADTKNIKEGMSVLFSGYPLSSESLTTHQGILSAITKDVTGVDTYLIDGTVNSGNSGCPLMDSEGNVIGIVNAKRVLRSDLLTKVREMSLGAISIHGVDLVEIYQALFNSMQLGIGYAVPVMYVPDHKEKSEVKVVKLDKK